MIIQRRGHRDLKTIFHVASICCIRRERRRRTVLAYRHPAVIALHIGGSTSEMICCGDRCSAAIICLLPQNERAETFSSHRQLQLRITPERHLPDSRVPILPSPGIATSCLPPFACGARLCSRHWVEKSIDKNARYLGRSALATAGAVKSQYMELQQGKMPIFRSSRLSSDPSVSFQLAHVRASSSDPIWYVARRCELHHERV